METWVDFLKWLGGNDFFGDRTPGKLSTLTREGRKTVQMAKKQYGCLTILMNAYKL